MESDSSKAAFEMRYPHLKNFSAMLEALNAESPRGMVLVATSYLDGLLKDIVSSFLISGKESEALLEGFNAPLGTYATRTTAAYCLGLISLREKTESDTLRRIRNRFAHDVHVSFADNDVVQLCQNLKMAAGDYGDVVVPPSGKFNTSATGLILSLTNRAHYVEQKRLVYREWKI